MSADTPHLDVLAGITPALEPAFRLDQLVALSPERALYKAWDRLLKRAVALRLHLVPGSPGRDWFLRETETLAALDHPAIRHVYALTGQEPALDPAAIVTPQRLRGTIPAAVERVILRALRPAPGDRYFTATEMLEDFVADAGTFHAPAAEPQHGESGFERRLRRALGD